MRVFAVFIADIGTSWLLCKTKSTVACTPLYISLDSPSPFPVMASVAQTVAFCDNVQLDCRITPSKIAF